MEKYWENNMPDNPFVSIIIPCRNEESFIGTCLDSIVTQSYPKDRMEVLVVDGMSEDKTRPIVERYAGSHPMIKLVNNPQKITPVAFNTGIKNAIGEIILIMSAHAVYDKEYISKCAAYLQNYEADNVGGLMITRPRKNTFIGKTVAQALSHRFGVGDSVFRTGTKEPTWVDTVFGGCYRKETFEKIGLFNEDLVSTQDMEFNLRLKKQGGKILLVPEIISYYYTRSDFLSFCKNNFRNGLWAVLPFKYSQIIPVSLRHLVPLAFVLSLVGSLVLSVFFPVFLWVFCSILGLYLITAIYFSTNIAIREKDVKLVLIMPFIFGSLHAVYGLGSLYGFTKVILSKKFWAERLKGGGSKRDA